MKFYLVTVDHVQYLITAATAREAWSWAISQHENFLSMNWKELKEEELIKYSDDVIKHTVE